MNVNFGVRDGVYVPYEYYVTLRRGNNLPGTKNKQKRELIVEIALYGNFLRFFRDFISCLLTFRLLPQRSVHTRGGAQCPWVSEPLELFHQLTRVHVSLKLINHSSSGTSGADKLPRTDEPGTK